MKPKVTDINEKKVLKVALTSRLVLFLVQYVSNLVIPDHEADAFQYPQPSAPATLDKVVSHFLGGFLRWDAQHFMHISLYGYTYEHTLAFFPLYPYLVRFITTILHVFIPFLSLDSLSLLIFWCVNTFCFIKTALCLYELSLCIVNRDLSYKASVLFCYNPASVFFSAPYTECLFSYLTYKCMLNCVLLYKKYCDVHSHLQIKDIVYIIPICLSTVTRSNGILNLGFLWYTLGCLYFQHVKLTNKYLCTFKFVILTISLTSLCLLPFILFEMYSFELFCKDFHTSLAPPVLEHKDIDSFVLPGTFSKHNQSWCFKAIPLAYSYVQSQYWKVGFLQYYEWKQVPNFLLALPIVYILLEGSFNFFKVFPKRLSQIFNFNLLQTPLQKHTSHLRPLMMVFVVHSTVLTIFCVLNIHVQVTTRMLCSASPVLFWFCAFYISNLEENLWTNFLHPHCYDKEYFIKIYFLSYFIVGTAMFCNFLPWT